MNHRGGGDGGNADISRGFLNNVQNRFFDTQNYPPQNPYESPLPENYFPYAPGYELDQAPSDHGNGRYGHGQATYHQHMYSTLGSGGSSGGGGGGGGHQHKSKNSALAMSALTLLAFLFFINILQSCLKEQMTSLNPTVMVMTAGRFRKTGIAGVAKDANKELNQNDHSEHHAIVSPVSDNIDLLTNDQGDVFYGPAPKLSFKLDNSFEARSADST